MSGERLALIRVILWPFQQRVPGPMGFVVCSIGLEGGAYGGGQT